MASKILSHLLIATGCTSLLVFGQNPVLPGDYPDPSVIRVGSQYWATATTSQWAPIFPLLRSRDLVHWTQAGAVFTERPGWAEINFWAPEIVAWKGRYFVYYTAKKKDGPLCVAVATAAHPGGPYTDHGPMVCQEAGSIDAMAVTDEAGRRFLIWKEDGNSRKQPTPLWAQPLSEDGTKLVGDKHELFRNDAPWESQLVEGPFVLRRNGYFYMFYSAAGCCGRGCNYVLGVARARRLLGPWEKYSGNPILKDNETWRCPGHGSIVEDERGKTWLLYHAYHAQASVYVGRQGMLDEVRWKADGWPEINGGRGPSVSTAERGAVSSAAWLWPVRQSAPPVSKAGGVIEVDGSAGAAVAARLPVASEYEARVRVEIEGQAPGASAGLAAYGNAQNLIALTAGGGKLKLSVWQRGTEAVAWAGDQPKARVVHLRMKVTGGSRFRFSWSLDGRQWTDVAGGTNGEHLPPWDLAPRVALLAQGGRARFGGFVMVPDAVRLSGRGVRQ